MSNARFIYLTFIALGVLTGLVVKSAAVYIFLAAGVADTVLLNLLPLSTVIALASAVLLFFGLLKNSRVVAYADEVIGELVKVTWPDREETTNSSMVVVVATVIFSGSLAIFDLVWANVTEFLFFPPSS